MTTTSTTTPSTQDRRVYVGNLSYNVKGGQLREFMSQGLYTLLLFLFLLIFNQLISFFFFNLNIAGEVVRADVLTLPSGRSKGCGIVEYSTSEEAQKAIEQLSNVDLNGRPVFVREDREAEAKTGAPKFSHEHKPRVNAGGSGGEPAQVYVTNIPFNSNWRELKDLFRIAGDVIRCDIFESHGRSKGTGVVLFQTVSDANNAINKLNGYHFKGRPLEVRMDKFYNPNASSRYGSSGKFTKPSFTPPPAKTNSPFTEGATGNGPMSDTVFVSNLPWATTDQDLYELFQSVGKVKQAEIKYDHTGRSSGAGVVKFDTPASAQIAIEKLTAYVYGKRPLSLSFVKYPADSTANTITVPTTAPVQSTEATAPSPVPVPAETAAPPAPVV